MRSRLPAPVVAACFAIASITSAPAARAQGTSKQIAAEALFRDARKLMAAGKLDEACPKFVAAERMDPTVGTALNVGECFERAGKTASAWAGFEEARRLARQAGDAPREAEAHRRATKIEPQLARLRLTAKAAIPAGAALKIDGEPLDAAVIGTAIPIDPGPHTITIEDPAGAWITTVTIPTKPTTLQIELAPPARAAAPLAPVAPSPPLPPLFWSPRRVAGAALGAAGVASVVVGSIFGMQAIAKKNESNDGPCDATNHCDPEGKRLRAEGLRAGNVSTATFIAGGAAIAGGVVLFITGAPQRASLTVALSAREARLEGSF